MFLLEKNIKPRDIVTKNFRKCSYYCCCDRWFNSTSALHLPALANEIGVKFDLMDVAKIFKKTPYLADLKPGGKYVAKDMGKQEVFPCSLKLYMMVVLFMVNV